MVQYNSRGDRGALEWVDPPVLAELEVYPGDIRDAESAANAVKGSEVVFHLAALIAIPYSYSHPRSVFETNVMGTLNVALACRDGHVRRLVHTSTSEVYGSAREVPITEEHRLTGQSPYAASKIAADQLIGSFGRSFELPATTVRPFNTYGPRQSARAVLPTIVSQALRGGPVRLGSLDPRRDMTYVADTATGFLAAAESAEAVGETLQLGTGRDVSVGDMVRVVGKVLGRELEVELDPVRVRPPASEVERLISSPEKMSELTGWSAQWSLEEGVEELVAWVDSRQDLYRADEYAT